jgi:hypothetical protein
MTLTPEQMELLLKQLRGECTPEGATWENTPVEGPIALTGTAELTGEGGAG